MRFLRLGVAVGAVVLILMASAPMASAATGASGSGVHSTLGGVPQTPARGPCLQNAAQCSSGGSLLSSGVPTGATPLIVLGPALSLLVLARPARRSRRAAGILAEGIPIHVMRPPRVLSVLA